MNEMRIADRRRGLWLRASLRIVALLIALAAPASGGGDPLPRTLVLMTAQASGADSIDQRSFISMLTACGLAPHTAYSVEELLRGPEPPDLIVVPAAAARMLSPSAAGKILARVRGGARLLLDGPGALSDAAGFTLGDPRVVRTVRDAGRRGRRMVWSDSVSVQGITGTRTRRDRVLYADAATGRPIGVLRNDGAGRILFLSTRFDPVTGEGYGRFPSLPSVLLGDMGLAPALRGAGAHAYFDPGYILNARDTRRIRMWRDAGITAVHVGMWQRYANEPFDYRWFVEEAHRHGIRVYLWLMWPYVGEGFWNAHPEWRQKNAALGDAKLDFLLLMDFQNPDCFSAAMRDFFSLLALDWDGVDIAEFSVTGGVADALAGASQPANLVGFGATARREFCGRQGFDPVALVDSTSAHFWKRDSAGLNAFFDYRAGVSGALLSRVIAAVDSANRLREFPLEIVLTVLDDARHPEFRRLLAYDGAFARDLAVTHGLTLQVEDPMSEWTRPPARYAEMGAFYRGRLGAHPFAIDINVVPSHWAGQPGFPSAQPTGTEFLLQWLAASERAEYVTFYSEFSVYAEDWKLLPFAMASGASFARGPAADTLRLARPCTFRSTAPVILLSEDGKSATRFPAGPIFLPAGTHVLRTHAMRAEAGARRAALRPLRGTGEVARVAYVDGGVSLRYSSRTRVPVTLSARPSAVRIDGRRVTVISFRNSEGVVVFLPPGKHEAECFE